MYEATQYTYASHIAKATEEDKRPGMDSVAARFRGTLIVNAEAVLGSL